jgi:hypothetical protein
MFLGKRPRRHDQRTLMMANYLTPALPPAPPAVDYTQGVTDWGMMRNDQLGCCTIAAVGHAVQAWTVNAGSRVNFADRTIDLYYEKWDGYNPANAATDQGGVELDVLNDWRQQGFAGHELDAYAAISLSGVRGPKSEVQTAIWLFGGAYIGVELPLTAQNQDVWDVADGPDAEPGSWGGHAIYLVGYDFRTSDSGLRAPDPGPSPTDSGLRTPDSGLTSATLTCITWGQTKKMTWAWFEKYCSEAYALVSKDWLKASGVAPSGFDLATLEEDLKAVSRQLSA